MIFMADGGERKCKSEYSLKQNTFELFPLGSKHSGAIPTTTGAKT